MRVSEIALAGEVIPHLRQEMLCLADRHFFSYPLWNKARASGADLLWRSKKNLILPCQQRLPDGSYLSRIYPSQRARRRGSDAVSGAGHRIPSGRGARLPSRSIAC